MDKEEILNNFIKEKLPNANAAFHYESEIASGIKDLQKWLTNNDYTISQSQEIEQLKESLKELCDLVEDAEKGIYEIDSFTTQPMRELLTK